jgi:etoposide-induced 2.4 mRNA
VLVLNGSTVWAFYCFDYRWGAESWSLERRLKRFEGNWAYFSGFGYGLPDIARQVIDTHY